MSAKPRLETISPKSLMPGQKSAQKPNDWASFHDFQLQSAKLENFQQVSHFLHSFIKYYTFLVKNCQKPDAWAIFTSQNLMPRQKLTPEIPNAWARTSVPTFIRESPLYSFQRTKFLHRLFLLSVITLIFATQCGKKL